SLATQTATAAGSTETRKRFVGFRSPPSSSYGRFRSRRISTARPDVTCTNGDRSGSLITDRPSARPQATRPVAVTTPISTFPSSAVQTDVDGSLDVVRDAEVPGQEVRRAGRDDGDRGRGRCHRVDAALEHPVSTPDEQEIRTIGDRLLDLLRRLFALRDLVPDGSVHPCPGERSAKLRQTASQGLARVREDRDGRHVRTSERSRSFGVSTRRSRRRSAATAAAWTARSAKQRAPTPSTTLAITSVG